MVISCQVFTDLLLVVYAGYSKRAVVGETGMIKTQMGMHNISNFRSEWDSLYDTIM
jgi:hypothetical protein